MSSKSSKEGDDRKEGVEGRSTREGFAAAWLRFKHKLLNVEQTEFHADFVQMVDDAREFGRLTTLLMKVLRGAAQPNPTLQAILISAPELEAMAKVLNDTSNVLKDKSPKTQEFYSRFSVSLLECQKLQLKFLSQVNNNVLKPIEKYVAVELVKIENEYQNLRNAKAHYDDAKNQLRLCRPERVDEVNAFVIERKTAFEKQANYVSDLLNRLPDHMEEQRKALRTFALAYRERCEQQSNALLKMLQETKESKNP